MVPLSPTFVVQLTSPGRGAVAVVLVAGPLAVPAVDSPFSAANGRPLDEQTIGRIVFGHWGVTTKGLSRDVSSTPAVPNSRGTPNSRGAPNSQDALVGEELVVCVRASDRVEVHPHGGVASARAVIETLVDSGCTHLDWKAWISHDEPDPIRAAAQVALADAPTERTAAILLDQWQGALRRAIDEIAASRMPMNALLARAELGRHLTQPWRVVLAGRPNVGKSSLANAILGYHRSITFEQPGTTRDVVTATTAIDGWPIELSDTAGLREGSDALEAAGVELAERQLAEADLVVWIEEAVESGKRKAESGMKIADCGMRIADDGLQKAGQGKRTLYVVNKIDLLDPKARLAVNDLAGSSSILASARTGEGVPGLLKAIATSLVPNPPPPGAAVPFTEAQVEMLRRFALVPPGATRTETNHGTRE